MFMRSLECYFGVYLINTKITLSWAHKQFATRVDTLFYMNSKLHNRDIKNLLHFPKVDLIKPIFQILINNCILLRTKLLHFWQLGCLWLIMSWQNFIIKEVQLCVYVTLHWLIVTSCNTYKLTRSGLRHLCRFILTINISFFAHWLDRNTHTHRELAHYNPQWKVSSHWNSL